VSTCICGILCDKLVATFILTRLVGLLCCVIWQWLSDNMP